MKISQVINKVEQQNIKPENLIPEQGISTALKTKTMVKHYDYDDAMKWLENKGKEIYGLKFQILETDRPLIKKLLCYFLKDELLASQLHICLHKGILLTGPVGCGKTTLMSLIRFFDSSNNKFVIKSCRDVSFEFIRDGYETIHKYSHCSFHKMEHKTYCYDDLGTENNLKYFGNECNVMAEVLLSRYDLFVSRKLQTHITTNLSASEIESFYGNRVRSRMREIFNLISFDKNSEDKRI